MYSINALTALQILSKLTEAHTSYYNFSKVCETKKKKEKIKKKNMKKVKRTLKVRISVLDGQIHLTFGIESTLPRGSFHSKNG